MGTTSYWRGRRVLITGATGFIGRHLVEQALRAGASVTTLSRSPANIPGTCAHLAVDIQDRESTKRAIKDLQPDAIMHTASSGVTGKEDFVGMMRSNVFGTDNLLSAAASLKEPPVVVIAGSGYEYAAQGRPLREEDPVFPTSPYGVSKAAATFCAAAYSGQISITVLRIFNVYGPGERQPRLLPYIVENARRGNPVKLTRCEQVCDFVYVLDIALIFWRALECRPENGELQILNVGSGSAVLLKDFVCTVIRALAKQGIKAELEFGSRPYRAGEPMYYVADNSRLQKVLGNFPFTTRESGIQESLESM